MRKNNVLRRYLNSVRQN